MKNISLSLCIASWVLWILSVLVSYASYRISLGCSTESDSIFGDSSWSLLPTGEVCTWNLDSGVSAVTGPSYITLLVPLVLSLWSLAIYIEGKNKKI